MLYFFPPTRFKSQICVQFKREPWWFFRRTSIFCVMWDVHLLSTKERKTSKKVTTFKIKTTEIIHPQQLVFFMAEYTYIYVFLSTEVREKRQIK